MSSVPATQKVLYLQSKQGPFVVEAFDIPSSWPGPDDVLVKIESTNLNPIDWKIQAYGLFVETYPTVLGFNAAGTVEAVGSNVRAKGTPEVGDRVISQGLFSNETNTFQQYISTPADLVVKIPDTLSYDEAATLPVACTAAISLYNLHEAAADQSARLTAPWSNGGLGKYVGQPAVVIGGSGSLGQAAIQFFKLSGFAPIIATASLRNASLAKSLGATHVVDRSLPTPSLVSEVQKIAGGPIGIVYDSISDPDTKNAAYDIVAPGGSLVLVAPEVVDPENKREEKGVKIVNAMGSFDIPQNRAFSVEFVKAFENILKDGGFKPPVVEVLPGGLHAIPGGLEKLKANEVSGKKLAVHPQETA